ncbi:single-stranded DNA-binding protein [Longispora sp. NPDC051575]|uniref:single-stranded DNA-binding protein n=1 Tax=Longispora sp. NPDC051575 TaxID=3154943 RepID=UPI0034401031
MLFNVTIEGRLTTSPEQGTTRNGREYTQFEMAHREFCKNGNQPSDASHFEVLCWGDLAARVRGLRRGDLVTVEAGKLLAYVDHDRRPGESGYATHERCGQPVLKLWARNVSVSMRFDDAYAGSRPARQRRGDVVTTPDGEQYAAEVYPEIVADLQLVHHTR